MKSKYNLLHLLALLFLCIAANAQYTNKHFIALSPWQYWSNANEIIVTTTEIGTVTATLTKSNGEAIINLTVTADTPAVYRFTGIPSQTPKNWTEVVYDNRGLIVEATGKISVTLRNVASDQGGTSGDNAGDYIKGNAAMLSYGDQGKGTEFLLGYYRTNFTGISGNAPVYSVMATEDNTNVKLNGVSFINLNAGQSYLFKAAIGSKLSTDKPVVANVGAYADTPVVCSDGVVTQIIPTHNIGLRYLIVRGSGQAGTLSNFPEQTTIIASEPGTVVVITNNSFNGIILNTTTQTLANAGDSFSFFHGDAANEYSTSHVVSSKPIIVYSGIANGCEIDMHTVMPIGNCTGAESFTMHKFTDYSNTDLDAFGYVITESPTEPVFVNGLNLETLTASFRTTLGNSGYFMLRFTPSDFDNAANLKFTSAAKMNAGLIQRTNSHNMAEFFSVFNEPLATPEISDNGTCTPVIIAAAGMAPYQWYLSGIAITDATAQQYSPKITGNYTVTATRDCGVTSQSVPVYVKVCSDLEIIKEIIDVVNGQITFKLTAKNNGPENETVAQVTDMLPSGYTYVSSVTQTGSYNNTTGVWSVGSLSVGTEASLLITAQVNTTGNHTNTATISGLNTDADSSNNTSSATPNGKLYLSKKTQKEVYYNIGEIILYDIVLMNTGNVTINDIKITDANADAGSINPSQVSKLAPGESISITAQHTVTLADALAGQVVNQANAVGESYNEIFVKVISDNPETTIIEDKTITPIVYQADLSITKTNNQDIYKKGTQVIYTITITNNGPSNTIDVTVTDALPAGIMIMEWSADNQTSGNGALNDVVQQLNVGESITYSVTLTVPETYEGNLSNTATVNSAITDKDLSNNEATDIDTPCTTCGAIVIPRGISPNNDTKNDVFDLSAQPQIEKLEVYNRYGQKVYSLTNYTNQWNGNNDSGKELPTGTYYYVIYYLENGTKTGWVYINREE
ncbi:hypothetical protein AMR72_01590 [Flavobacterium psychrophilum]|nr:hypothetical protein AMR72_01590 [Flavobacterium psychrophilum]AOE51329.1 hypothetical protein ALW18_01590 [Flavobacterium psychrophilum]